MNRTTRQLTHDGHTAPLNYWADKIGITKEALMNRLMHGWSVAEAITTPKNARVAKKVRRQLPRIISDEPAQSQGKPLATRIVPPLYEELKRQHLAMERQFNSLLRQFCRDLHGLMGRGVVVDLLKTANDRTTPVARDLS